MRKGYGLDTARNPLPNVGHGQWGSLASVDAERRSLRERLRRLDESLRGRAIHLLARLIIIGCALFAAFGLPLPN